MRNHLLKSVLALVALSPFFTGCDNVDQESLDRIDKLQKFDTNFVKEFGTPDPNHDWSMATRVTANIDLSNAPEGTYDVSIYSQKNGYLLKKAILDQSAELTFDAIKGEDAVRIIARKTSALGLAVINGYYPVKNGMVNTASQTRAASTAEQCNTTVGDQLDLGTKTISHNLYQYEAAAGDYYSSYVSSLPTDGKYYITTIAGQDYSDGADGKYLVTRNGTSSQMTMHEIADVINSGNYLMYKTEVRTIYSTDQDWNASYATSPDVETEYDYHEEAGQWTGETMSSLPSNDGKYYIAKIAGQDYSNGSNGLYSVTYNGSTSQKDMYEIENVIKTNNYRCYTTTSDGVSASYYGIPAYYSFKRYKINVEQYHLAGGTYVKPAYYKTVTNNEFSVKWASDFYYLNNVYKSIDPETQMLFDDLLPLVSASYEPDTHFHEAEDNRVKWEDDLDFNVELVLKENGPMTYTYVFYGSIYHNMLGYFYWFETDGMTEAEKKAARTAAPRYVLMNDTWPEDIQTETGKPNLQCYNDQDGSGAHTPQGMSMPQWVDTGIEQHTGHYLQGTTYHMVYFGQNYDQPASYTFPQGAHVAFFLITKATSGGSNQNNKGTGLFYSIKDMNNDNEVFQDAEGNNCIVNDKHWWASEVNGQWNPEQERPNEGEVAAVFYNYKGSMVLGFEDDVDKDENDMLFFISAPINPPKSITEETDMSWVIACEDLGSFYDYDFNDIVFDLGQATFVTVTTTDGITGTTSSSSSVKAELYLQPLAAGGTLPAYIYYDNQEIGEIHNLLKAGAPTNIPLNVGGASVDVKNISRIKLCDIEEPLTSEEEFTSFIAAQLAKIKIIVKNNGNKEANEILAPQNEQAGDAPQMLILPRGWDWPKEEVHITDVYPAFKDWVESMEKNGWISTPRGKYMTNPLK